MKTTSDFLKMKQNREKIVMVTAYDYPAAKYAEEAEVDMILVGDSLGMVVLGYDSTVQVTVEDMIHHEKAVRRGAKDTFLAGIPVVAHLGLTPQSVGVLGGYKVQGKTAEQAKNLIEDALRCQEAGAMALVLECIPHQLTEIVSNKLVIPTIGIGAGPEADGQVLVFHDLLRYGNHHIPKFAKEFANVGEHIQKGIEGYTKSVKDGSFPAPEHCFNMKDEELFSIYGGK